MNGSLCMDAFFVLSGFLIGGQLIREIRDTQGIKLGKFFLKRVIRIFPPYYLFLLIQYLLLSNAAKSAPPELAAQIAEGLDRMIYDWLYLTDYIHGIMIHGWSLSVEEKFYLTLPFLLLLIGRIQNPRFQIGALMGLFTIPTIIRAVSFVLLANDGTISHEHYNQFVYYPYHSRMDSLFLGVALAAVYVYYPDALQEFINSKKNQILGRLAVALILLLMVITDETNAGIFTAIFRLPVSAFAWLALILLTFRKDSWLGKFFSLRIFVPIARVSYCSYIIHLALLGVLARIFIGYESITYTQIFIWFIPLGALILSIGYLYYLFAERPFLALKEKAFGRKPALNRLPS